MERHREDMWVEAPKGPFGEVALEGEGHRICS